MDNYNILSKLGKGSQGEVFLVEHVSTKGRFVMKRIECCDESEANKAYRESLVLATLQHPYICTYKEFFVTWDAEISAMNLCIIMSYYTGGSLSEMVEEHRRIEKNVEEEELKKGMGQILESMMFFHQKKIIHRDLKPSNIFRLHDEGCLCIGDFGVPTVMADVRTKSRTTFGSMNWMAPEALDKEYDERSDVWSAGCIMAEMATCSSWDADFIAGKLLEIKHNDEALEEVFEQVALNYSSDMVDVLRVMLNRNYKERPTAIELADFPYVKDCLDLNNSLLVKKKHQQQTLAAQRPVPKNGGSQPVIDYILTYMNNESCVRQALLQLIELGKADGEAMHMDPTSKRVIVKAMREYIGQADMQETGCKVISNLLISATSDDILYSSEILSVLPLVMRSHLDSSSVQQSVALLLVGLAADNKASDIMGGMGCIQDVLNAMQTFPDDSDLLIVCCNALWSLTVTDDNTRLATEYKAVKDVLKVLEAHPRCAELVQHAFAALLSLSTEDENLDVLNRSDCVGIILDAMQFHIDQPKVVKNACTVLAAIVEPEEECAYRVLANPRVGSSEEIQGLPIIVNAYKQHKDNSEVVTNICMLMMELVEYDEICAEIKHMKLDETILKEVHKRYKDNVDIMSPCESTLSKLSGGKLHLETEPTRPY